LSGLSGGSYTELIFTPPITTSLQIPREIVYPAPTQRRFYRYWKDPADPDPGVKSGFKLAAEAWVTGIEKTFVTGPLSGLLKLTISAQFTVAAGVSAFKGIYMKCTVSQGASAQIVPGLGDEFNGFFARRDTSGDGVSLGTSYSSAVEVAPNTNTTVKVEFQSKDTDGYIVFLNVIADF
jgi:hypothetical protein